MHVSKAPLQTSSSSNSSIGNIEDKAKLDSLQGSSSTSSSSSGAGVLKQLLGDLPAWEQQQQKQAEEQAKVEPKDEEVVATSDPYMVDEEGGELGEIEQSESCEVISDTIVLAQPVE